jgi:hypothetical protein
MKTCPKRKYSNPCTIARIEFLENCDWTSQLPYGKIGNRGTANAINVLNLAETQVVGGLF